MLRLGFELARRGYRRYAAYPGATWAGVFTNTFFGFMIAYALLAVFEQRDAVGDYDARDAVTYAWLAQGMLMTIYLWGWFEVALRVRSGDVATDLQRPLDFQRVLARAGPRPGRLPRALPRRAALPARRARLRRPDPRRPARLARLHS